MKIGFTGSQYIITSKQRDTLYFLLQGISGELHHGDCIEADSWAHDIGVYCGLKPIIHPPDIMSKRAFKKADDIRKPKPYLDRNKDIVNETDELIATPKEFNEQLRSGTWSTIRYARKLGRKITIINPDGSLRYINAHT